MLEPEGSGATGMLWGKHIRQANSAYQLCPPHLRQLIQDTTSMTLALRTRECRHRSLNLVPSLASEPEDSPEPQVQIPASTTPARVEEGEEEEAQKRRRRANQHPSSQYEL